MNLINRIAGLSASLVVMAALSACQQTPAASQEKLTNLCQPQRAPGSAACQWSETLQQQLTQQFRDAARYAGQQCWVRLEWQRSGRYAVTQTQGDEALCLRAWQLIGQARQLPPPPDRAQPAWFGFAPHQLNQPARRAVTDAG